MYKRIIIFLSIIIGLSFGVSVGPHLWANLNIRLSYLSNPYINAIIFGLLFILLGTLTAPLIEKSVKRLMEKINQLSISATLLMPLFSSSSFCLGSSFTFCACSSISKLVPHSEVISSLHQQMGDSSAKMVQDNMMLRCINTSKTQYCY